MSLFLATTSSYGVQGEVRVSNYYVSTIPQEDGDHVVHAEGCPQLQFTPFRVNLGEYPTSDDAVQKAKILYAHVKGCDQCSAGSTTTEDVARSTK